MRFVFEVLASIFALLSVAGIIALGYAFNHTDEMPECYDEDERLPFEFDPPRSSAIGGNSHDRRLGRRRIQRANKLRNA